MKKQINRSDLISGAFFLAVGVFYGLTSYDTLPIGDALNMGPGYFPIVLACVVALLGAAIMLRSLYTVQEFQSGVVPYRAILLITIAILIFSNLLEQLGLPLCVFVTSLIAYYAKRDAQTVRGCLIAAGISVFCTGVFGYGINLPIPFIGTWIGG